MPFLFLYMYITLETTGYILTSICSGLIVRSWILAHFYNIVYNLQHFDTLKWTHNITMAAALYPAKAGCLAASWHIIAQIKGATRNNNQQKAKTSTSLATRKSTNRLVLSGCATDHTDTIVLLIETYISY